jgi:cobalt/nickel transport system permease protein
MHIPDGFLSLPVWAALDITAVPAAGYMVRRAQQEFEEKKVPLLGVMGAFVFAAQMINFPVGGATSGHLVGSALLSFTLGPAAASVVMIAILAIQALVFQDGGILALGANIFNMAVVGVIAGYLPFHLWGAGRGRKAAIFVGGAFSVLVAALLAVSELLLSGIAMSGTVLGVSFGLFTVSALLEGAITLAVFQALESLNPNFVKQPKADRGLALVLTALAAVLLAVVGVLFASAHPDGLERLTETLGIASKAKPILGAPLADYEAGFGQSAWLRKAGAGFIGLGLIYGACTLLGRMVGRRRSV